MAQTPNAQPPNAQPGLAEDLREEAAKSRADAADARATVEVERLREDLATLRRDFTSLSRTLREMAMARGEEGAALMRTYADQARGQAQRYVEGAEDYVVRNPLTSVAAAFGIGYLLGRIMERD